MVKDFKILKNDFKNKIKNEIEINIKMLSYLKKESDIKNLNNYNLYLKSLLNK